MSDKRKKTLITKSITIVALIVIVDQISKYFIRVKFPINSSIQVIDGFFNIVNVTNRGIAFGMLEKFSMNQSKAFILITIISIGILFYFYIGFLRGPNHNTFIVYTLSGIIGGAIGNFIDRLFLGYVTDFFLVYYRNFTWPAFNVADIFISIGAVSLIIFIIFEPEPKKEIINGESNA